MIVPVICALLAIILVVLFKINNKQTEHVKVAKNFAESAKTEFVIKLYHKNRYWLKSQYPESLPQENKGSELRYISSTILNSTECKSSEWRITPPDDKDLGEKILSTFVGLNRDKEFTVYPSELYNEESTNRYLRTNNVLLMISYCENGVYMATFRRKKYRAEYEFMDSSTIYYKEYFNRKSSIDIKELMKEIECNVFYLLKPLGFFPEDAIVVD